MTKIETIQVQLTEETITALANLNGATINISTASYASNAYWTGSSNGTISRKSDVQISGSLLLSGSANYVSSSIGNFSSLQITKASLGSALIVTKVSGSQPAMQINNFNISNHDHASLLIWHTITSSYALGIVTAGNSRSDALRIFSSSPSASLLFNGEGKLGISGSFDLSGSSQIGRRSADTHKFIGSVNITGSVEITGSLKVGDVKGGNYWQVNDSGNMSYVGSASFWDDMLISAEGWRLGSTAPTVETGFRGNANFLSTNFIHTQADEIQFKVQFSHRYKSGTTIQPHFHFSPWGTETGSVAFKLEYYWADVAEQFPATTGSFLMTESFSSNKQWYHLIADNETGIDGTGKDFSSILYCRLYRDNTIANNYPNKVSGLYFDVHYQTDSPGTQEEYVK